MVAVVACMHSASQQSSTGPVTHKEGGVLQAQVVGHEVRVIGWSRALFCKGKGAHQGRQGQPPFNWCRLFSAHSWRV
eukprot:scaffold65355_cov21-Tisochrysis_lutea.AAC.5